MVIGVGNNSVQMWLKIVRIYRGSGVRVAVLIGGSTSSRSSGSGSSGWGIRRLGVVCILILIIIIIVIVRKIFGSREISSTLQSYRNKRRKQRLESSSSHVPSRNP